MCFMCEQNTIVTTLESWWWMPGTNCKIYIDSRDHIHDGVVCTPWSLSFNTSFFYCKWKKNTSIWVIYVTLYHLVKLFCGRWHFKTLQSPRILLKTRTKFSNLSNGKNWTYLDILSFCRLLHICCRWWRLDLHVSVYCTNQPNKYKCIYKHSRVQKETF